MLYSTLIVATTAFAGFAAAQNATSDLPTGFPTCCTPQTAPNSTVKEEWCNANQNTCVDLCGTQGDIAAKGNDCDDDTLDFTCKCRNGTEPDMNIYQQSVPGLQCREWFRQCVIAAGDGFQSAEWKRNCEDIQTSECGNLTADGKSVDPTSSGSPVSSRTSSGSPSPTSSGESGATSETPGAAAMNMAREFGLPILAGGLVAVFGIAL